MSGLKVGFNFVPMPQEIWDKNIPLSLPEFRLLGYLIRYQLRFQNRFQVTTFDELLHGVWGKKKGVQCRIDQGCGLSRNGIKAALETLEARGWITAKNTSDNPQLPRLEIELQLSPEDSSDCHGATVGVTESKPDCHGATVSYKEVEVVEEKTIVDALFESPDETPVKLSRNDQIKAIIVDTVYPHYMKEIREGQSEKIYSLTPKRINQGRKRFEECLQKTNGDLKAATELMLAAIDAMQESHWHMGRDPQTSGRKYNDWENLFRSAEQLEKWLVRAG